MVIANKYYVLRNIIKQHNYNKNGKLSYSGKCWKVQISVLMVVKPSELIFQFLFSYVHVSK